MSDIDSLALGYVLIALGIVFLAAEFVFPTAGILPVMALASTGAGVLMTFVVSPKIGFVTLLVLFVVVPLAGRLLLEYWPHTPMGKQLILNGPDEDQTVASLPTNLELEHLRGRLGRTLSALRPSGVTDFDGKRVDTMSEGMLIEAGKTVRCLDVRAGRVIVREVQPRGLADLETMDWETEFPDPKTA